MSLSRYRTFPTIFRHGEPCLAQPLAQVVTRLGFVFNDENLHGKSSCPCSVPEVRQPRANMTHL